VDKDGKNVLEAIGPKEFNELAMPLHPRGEHVFFHAYDPDTPPVGAGERRVRHMPAARRSRRRPPVASASEERGKRCRSQH
jgi:menaquinone-dependent protoporphyrinogen oxidase